MKKFTAYILTIILLVVSSTLAFANDMVAKKANQNSIVMAINEEIMVSNGVEAEGAAPLLILGKTYVDLYTVAPLLDVSIEVVEGFYNLNVNEQTYKFTTISIWKELLYQKHKFFVKDSKIYVSLRELVDLAGYDITYNKGLITIGSRGGFNPEIYGDINTLASDDYVYKAYPSKAEHVVYPYQKYSYETMLDDAEKLKSMYPELITTSSIGKSVEDRDLLLIKFGKGEYKVFVCGAHHAREYITTTYLMYAIDRYAYAYETGSMWGGYNPKEILDKITFYIVPMINPDGVNLVINGLDATKNPAEIASMGIYESSQYGYLAWKANMHGVDLNWNYDKDWSVTKNKNPRGSAGFTGERPATEPETIAVSNYVDNNEFEAYLSFHTQGEIFYWADNKDNPSYINVAVKKSTGFVGYKDEGTGIGGSFFDYVYRKYNKPTITVELCPYVGNYPYPDEDFDRVWNPTKNVLLAVGNEIIYNKSK